MRVLSVAVSFSLLICLTACSGVSGEDRMAGIRQSFSDAAAVSFAADVRADYGDRVMDFGLDFTGLPDDGVITVTSPALIAGAQVKLGDGGTALSYSGAEVYTGEILPDGLSPVDAVPVMVSAWREGLITETAKERWGDTDCLAVIFRVDDDVDLRTWFDVEGLPLHAEFTFDGCTVITADFYDMKVE